MPDLRLVLFALRDPVLVSILVLHAAAILAAIAAPLWVRSRRVWSTRVLVLGLALPAAILLRLAVFHAAAPPGTASVSAATLEFAAVVFPYVWLGPALSGLAWVLGSSIGHRPRWIPNLLAAAAALGLLWSMVVMVRAARTWPL